MTTPQRYRKRPVEIEACQWLGTAESATSIIDWILRGGGTARYHGQGDRPGSAAAIAIDTEEGTITGLPSRLGDQGRGGRVLPLQAGDLRPDLRARVNEQLPGQVAS